MHTNSDAHGKDNIVPFADSLCGELVSKIKQKHCTHTHAGGRVKVGFIGQALDKVFPSAVTKMPRRIHGVAKEIDDYHMVSHNQLLAVLWGACRDLKTRMRLLESKYTLHCQDAAVRGGQ
jgi:hypothetical protein